MAMIHVSVGIRQARALINECASQASHAPSRMLESCDRGGTAWAGSCACAACRGLNTRAHGPAYRCCMKCGLHMHKSSSQSIVHMRDPAQPTHQRETGQRTLAPGTHCLQWLPGAHSWSMRSCWALAEPAAHSSTPWVPGSRMMGRIAIRLRLLQPRMHGPYDSGSAFGRSGAAASVQHGSASTDLMSHIWQGQVIAGGTARQVA